MPAQRRLKMINFDLSVEKLEEEFGQGRYRNGYSRVRRFFESNGFKHHQYSGYLSDAAMSYAEVYDLVLNKMTLDLPWLATCVEKFDATNVTSQSNMLNAIRSQGSSRPVSAPVLLEADIDVTI